MTQTGTLFLDPTPDADGLLPGTGSVTLTAANGDELRFDYVGRLDPATGRGTGTFTLTGGTGRFAGATGSGSFAALLDLTGGFGDVPMTVTIDGAVRY